MLTGVDLGRAIDSAIKKMGMSPAEVAREFGIKQPSVSGWIRTGRISKPNFEKLRAMASSVVGPEHWGLTRHGDDAHSELQNFEDGPRLHGTVPLISWVQAGDWQGIVDNLQPGEGERIATSWRVKSHTYALRVRGDSMEPRFPDGAILIVEPNEDPEPGAFVIVRQNGDEATFKQLIRDGGRQYLKPLNPRYPIMELKPDAVFCGVVKRIEMDV